MDALDALIAARVTKPAGVLSGDVPVWNGTTFVRPSGTPSLGAFLRGDATWAGAYTAYPPTFTATGGGAPALGNATVSARYLQIGKLVHAYGTLTLGTTTSFGTGTLGLLLPVTAAQGAVWGQGEGVDLSTGNRAELVVAQLTDLAHMQFIGQTTFNGAGAGVSGTTPFPWSWATGDTLSWNLFYEAA
jgi:hypothetical protein